MNKLYCGAILVAGLSLMILFGYIVYSVNVTEQFYIAHGYSRSMLVGHEYPVWIKDGN